MPPLNSIYAPQAPAGRCSSSNRGQRASRNPPAMTKATNSRCASTSILARSKANPSSMRSRSPVSGARPPHARSPRPLEPFEPGDAGRTGSEREQHVARVQVRKAEDVAQARHKEHAGQEAEGAANDLPQGRVADAQRGRQRARPGAVDQNQSQ